MGGGNIKVGLWNMGVGHFFLYWLIGYLIRLVFNLLFKPIVVWAGTSGTPLYEN
jgi:hypothetical protein